MVKSILMFVFILLLGCAKDQCDSKISPFGPDELLFMFDTIGKPTRTQYHNFDLSNAHISTFVNYLASIDAFDHLNILSVGDSIIGTYISPYFLEPIMDDNWIGKNERKYLINLINCKTPSIPALNSNVAALPTQLSTIGIEAMHLIHYSFGNEATYTSNEVFCTLEEQDSLAVIYEKRYKYLINK